MSQALIVNTTVGDRADAHRIAEQMVERKLAACVQVIGPMESHYFWDGKLQRDLEWLCLIKTREACYEQLEQALQELHPYDEPQIVATPILHGSAGYLDWLEKQTTP